LASVSFLSLRVFYDLNAHGGFGRFNWRNFQHGDEARPLVILAVQMTPCVCALGFWVAVSIKNFRVSFPDRLALKNFMDGQGLAPRRAAVVQLRNRNIQF
jgi:hypothetical protein